jgi:TonB family protein
MNAPIMWFLLANIGFAVLWSFYRIFLHRDTFFTGKRFTLLLGLLFTLIYPLLNMAEWMPVLQHVQKLTQNVSLVLPEITVTAQGSVAYTTMEIVSILYLSIIGLLLTRVLFQFSRLLLMTMRNKSAVVDGQKVICLPKGSAPFSFFSLVFIHPEDHSESDLNEILHHERTHVRQAHTLDVLFVELICTVFWINPFVWLLKYDLRENLEFLADKDVVHAGFDPKSYQYHLLRLSYQQSPIRMGNNFNVSQLQNRIKMMNKKRTSQVGWGKYFLILPLFAALLLVSYACKNKTEKDTNMNRTVEAVVPDTRDSVDTAFVAPPPPPVKSTIKFVAPKTEKGVRKIVKFTAPVILSQGKDSVFYNGVERMPQYPGGDEAMLKFIHDNLKYPFVAASNGIEGRVTIRFVVSKTGEINDIKVIRGLLNECDDEGVRVIKMMPKWEPGMNKGEPVNVYYTLPIVFKLQK